MMHVSIIIPAYNEEGFIAETLQSLKNQTYTNYEIIVVNNNSTDQTPKIAKKYTDKVFLEKKKGYHYAVSRGVKEAKGEIITVCDADTYYPKSWLHNAISLFEQPDVISVYGLAMYKDGNFLLKYVGGLLYIAICYFSYLLGTDITGGYNFLFTKKAYLQSGGYNVKKFNMLGMDIELGTRIKKIGKLLFSPRLIVYISTRRIQRDGYFKTTKISAQVWINFLLRKPQTVNYDRYTQGVHY